MNKKLLVTSLLSSMLLASCSASNPLEKKPPEETARLLTKTSQTAMERLGYDQAHSRQGYAHCMEGKTDLFFDCDTLYQMMTKVLAEQKIGVRTADIKSPALYEHIKNDLKLQSFF